MADLSLGHGRRSVGWERFTERARRVVYYAQAEAIALGVRTVDAEHLLAGILIENQTLSTPRDSAAILLLRHLGVSDEVLGGELDQMWKRWEIPDNPSEESKLPLGRSGRQTIRAAVGAARQWNDRSDGLVGTAHLLLGIAADEDGAAGQVLSRLGVTSKRLWDAVEVVLK